MLFEGMVGPQRRGNRRDALVLDEAGVKEVTLAGGGQNLSFRSTRAARAPAYCVGLCQMLYEHANMPAGICKFGIGKQHAEVGRWSKNALSLTESVRMTRFCMDLMSFASHRQFCAAQTCMWEPTQGQTREL